MIKFVRCDYCEHYIKYENGLDYCDALPEGFESLKDDSCSEGYEYVPSKEKGWQW